MKTTKFYFSLELDDKVINIIQEIAKSENKTIEQHLHHCVNNSVYMPFLLHDKSKDFFKSIVKLEEIQVPIPK